MKNIAEKTAEIRSIWDPTETHERVDRLDIELIVETYQQQYPDADITCAAEDTGEVPVQNGELFKMAMNEAVTNAIEHADQSPPEVTITTQRNPDASKLRITVADNGPGIPEFERQVIESGEETPLKHSLGIDLWLIEWITTALGGELIITDNEPRGTRVTFQLPLAE
jgi:signal transduction histidine kinase